MFSKTAIEIIDSLPQDLGTARIIHPTGVVVDITRPALVDGLRSVESLEDPKYSLKSVDKSIKKLATKAVKGKKYNNKNLCDDVGIWFCFELLSGRQDLQMTKAN